MCLGIVNTVANNVGRGQNSVLFAYKFSLINLNRLFNSYTVSVNDVISCWISEKCFIQSL